jgi:hypothetical protein
MLIQTMHQIILDVPIVATSVDTFVENVHNIEIRLNGNESNSKKSSTLHYHPI